MQFAPFSNLASMFTYLLAPPYLISFSSHSFQTERFYSALGDALVRIGRRKDADSIYNDGAKFHLFLDKYQRPLFKEHYVKTKTWWTEEESGALGLVGAVKIQFNDVQYAFDSKEYSQG